MKKINMTDLERRIIDISFNKKLGHIGSCLTSVGIIDKIYSKKKEDEPFILSNGHAGLALYVVLEKYNWDYGNLAGEEVKVHYTDAEELFNRHGVHPNRDEEVGIWASTGSLGQGLPIALGMALADKNRNVYCLISDGECAEGSIWEALRIQDELNVNNLFVYVNINGFGAYGKVNESKLKQRLGTYHKNVFPIITDSSLIAEGLEAHYKVLNEREYKVLTEPDFRGLERV